MHTKCDMRVTVWQLIQHVYYLSLHKTQTVKKKKILVTYHNGIADIQAFEKRTITSMHSINNLFLAVNLFLITLKKSFILQNAYILFYKHVPAVMT